MATDAQVNTLSLNLRTLINERLKILLREESLGVAGVKAELQNRLLQRIQQYGNRGDHASLDRLQDRIQSMMRSGTHRSNPGYNSSPPQNTQYSLSDPRSSGPGQAYPGSMPLQGSQSREIRFTASPFHQIERCLAGPVECKVRENTRDQIEIKLNLTSEVVTRLTHEPNLRVMVYCAADTGLNGYTRSEIAFPHQVELKVNLDDVKGANLRGLKNRPGSTRPADITDHLRKKPGYINTVTMTYALTNKNVTKQKFFVQVNLIKRIPVDVLVDNLKTGKTISKEQVLREMRSRAQDTDIVATSTVMSLKCPLSTLRIDVPCRSVSCSHNQCFDAASFLQLQEQAPTWTCPVCSKATSYESLTVDQYVNDILHNTSRSIDQVTIEPDGAWSKMTSPETPGLTNSSKSPVDDDVVDEDDDLVEVQDFRISSLKRANAAPPLTPTATQTTPSLTSREPSTSVSSSIPRSGPGTAPLGSTSNKRPASAVIDLTLSDSDDDDDQPLRPPPKRQSLASSEASSSQGMMGNSRYIFPIPTFGSGGGGNSQSSSHSAMSPPWA